MYGTNTRSYNRSTERREMKRQCAETTAKYEAGELKVSQVSILICNCRSFRFPHEVEAHGKLLGDLDWRSWEQRRNTEIYDERIY